MSPGGGLRFEEGRDGPAARAAGSNPSPAPKSPPRTMKIVVCGGHPGDPEYGCGGTIAGLTALGHEVVLLYLNDGAWPPTPAPTRKAEAARACEILKARPAYAGQVNGHAVARFRDIERGFNRAEAFLLQLQSPYDIFSADPP